MSLCKNDRTRQIQAWQDFQHQLKRRAPTVLPRLFSDRLLGWFLRLGHLPVAYTSSCKLLLRIGDDDDGDVANVLSTRRHVSSNAVIRAQPHQDHGA